MFSKIFSLAAFAPLRFIPHLEMQTCNVLYQLHLYFLGSLSLTDSFQNSLKIRINRTKLRYIYIQCLSKNCLRRGVAEKGGDARMGKSAKVVRGIDAPAQNTLFAGDSVQYTHTQLPINNIILTESLSKCRLDHLQFYFELWLSYVYTCITY